MKKQILHFSVHQTSKVIGFTHFLFGAVITVPVLLLALVITGELRMFLMLLYPFMFLIMGYLGSAVFTFFYNFVAASFGGIEFTLGSDEEKGANG